MFPKSPGVERCRRKGRDVVRPVPKARSLPTGKKKVLFQDRPAAECPELVALQEVAIPRRSFGR